MTFLARSLERIQPSPTMAVTQKAAELKAAGRDVIGLGAGEPDFDTPDFIKDAAVEAIMQGQTKYTAVDGTPALKQAIIEKFARENNLHYSAQEISVGCGGKQVLYNALLASLNPEDEVLIPAPYWVSYPDIVRLAGANPIFLPTRMEDGFKIRPQDLAGHITDRTKWIILNSPSNPTGAVYSRSEMQAICGVIAQYPDLYVLSDDIYEHLVYDDAQFVTPAQISEDIKQRCLTLNGVSKAYAMTGWRIGYAGGPAPLIKAMAKIQSQSTSNPCSISQAAALAALQGDQSFLEEWRLVFARRRDLVVRAINRIKGLSTAVPQGAFYLFVSCAGIIGRVRPDNGEKLESDQDVAAYLLEEAGVAVVPGAAFGLSPFFRISYATSDEILQDAMARLSHAIDSL